MIGVNRDADEPMAELVEVRPRPVSPSAAAPKRAVRLAGSGRPLGSALLTVLAVVGLAGVVLVQGADPTASPDPSASQLTTPAATSSGEPSLEPTPSFEPSPSIDPSPSSAPSPTRPASGESRLWHRERLDAMARRDNALGMWEIGDRFVILGGSHPGDGGRWDYLLISRDGVTWKKVAVTRDLGDVGAAAVGDGRLWLLSRPVGSDDSAGWELVSTHDGTDWTSYGRTDLRAEDDRDLSGLVRTGVGWLALIRETLWESTDGLRWTQASEQPTVTEESCAQLARLGSATLVFSGPCVTNAAGPRASAMVRRDGDDSWQTSAFTTPPYSSIGKVACSSVGCVASGERDGESVAWHSHDGLTWSSVDLDMPPGNHGSQAGEPVAAADGFVIISRSIGRAWLSTNGSDWRLIRISPVDLNDDSVFYDYIGLAVASDDLIVALGSKQDGPEALYIDVWVGRFSEMLR
jgi:hypothetical protein